MMTLLKHEFIRTRDMLALVTGAAVLLTLAGTLFAATGWPVLTQLGLLAGVVAVIGLVPAAQILLAVQFRRSSYGRTGYLTQTLPVKGSTIYWAKMIWAWLVSLVGTILCVGMALAASPLVARGVGGEPDAMLTAVREGWRTLTEVAGPWAVIGAIAALLAMVLIWPTQYFFAVSIGSQAPLNRMGMGGPVLVWLGVYLVVQVATFASFAAIPLAFAMEGGRLTVVHFDLFAEMAAGNSADVMPFGFVPALLVMTVVCCAWSVRSWNRRVSLV